MFQVGAAIALQCKRLGIHINFAPDVDINNNPKNPIIGFRSFGDNKYRVAQLGAAYSNGMMSEQVLSCAKHFPGHGDVSVDSHNDLPVVNKSLAQIDTLELYPFYAAIREGVPAVMVAHMHFPQLDNRPNRSASLSKYVIDTLLKQRMKFQGLVFTDAMNMKGVAKFYAPGYADLEALLAGNDVLLFSENVQASVALIKAALTDGRMSIAALDEKVRKILKWKQYTGLDHYAPIPLKGLQKDLLGEENNNLLQKVANQTVSVAKNDAYLVPLKPSKNIAAVAIGDISTSWKKELQSHGVTAFFVVDKNLSIEKQNKLVQKLAPYSTVIVSLHQPKIWSQQTSGYTPIDYKFINVLSIKKKTVVVGFCNPYALQNVNSATIICGYEDYNFYHKSVANLIFGKLKAEGECPVHLKFDQSSATKNAKGIDTGILKNIDGIVEQLINKKGAPGCRVYALKNGEVMFNKSYGYLNYNKKQKVNDSTFYDIASITKIAATTLCVMKLYEEGKLDITKNLGYYLPQAKGTNKENLIISDILQHRAGLTAWIPFYKETLPFVDSVYCSKEDSAYCIKVADKFFMLKANRDTVYKRVFNSQLESRTYRYSDLSMILMQLVVENISGQTLDVYVADNFYKPLGLHDIGFNPWKNHSRDNIAPTQEDRLFRQQEICGYVHDPAAAMLGGVSGHAGIFSTVQDLAVIMQMLNNGGTYNNKRYLQAATIEKFTAYQRNDSRRGLGFDKPDFSGKTSPASNLVSPLTFGHTGFTGTCAWADPKNGLVFIFLSNRICPDEENKELIQGNYRIKIQDTLYNAIGIR